MKIEKDFEKYYGKMIKIFCIDDIIIAGRVTGVVSALDSEQNLQELDIIADNGIYYNITENEILKIEII